jgi:23S rRNA (cytosine1962-C5)-methyltransferase
MSSPTTLPTVHLAVDDIARGPWVFGRNVRPPARDAAVDDGALVEVRDASGRFVGHALYNGRSDVRLRWLSRGRRSDLADPAAFVLRQLRAADRLRRKTLRLEERSDAYRVVHAEGDDLPGLVVDRLGDVLVCEYHALGFWNLGPEVEAGLRELYPGLSIARRVPRTVRRQEGFVPGDDDLAGGPDEARFTENGVTYRVPPATGHKTGWFCDQRDNRVRVADLCRGRDVLDLCTNAGGFALQAARAGARRVRGVDLDEEVLELAVSASRENELDVDFVHADTFDYLRGMGAEDRPDVVILDPPKLATGRAGVDAALHKYGDFNHLALSVCRPGGLLATFSCSGAVDLATFLGAVFRAARRAERRVRLLEVLGAGPDHPQRPEWPRSRYLKGALLAVDHD